MNINCVLSKSGDVLFIFFFVDATLRVAWETDVSVCVGVCKVDRAPQLAWLAGRVRVCQLKNIPASLTMALDGAVRLENFWR